MSISNINPQPKDIVILQRDDTNSQYNETHISGSDLIIYVDSSGYINADKSASFYAAFPTPDVTATNAVSASWASSSLSASWAQKSDSASFFITRNNPLPVDQRTVVLDTTARDSIPLADRYLGLSVWVTNDSQAYTLIGGTNNGFWIPTPISASHALNADVAVTASFALNGGGSGGSSNLQGVNGYVPTWLNNDLTQTSLINATSYNVGLNTLTPGANDTLTVTQVSSSNILWNPTLLSVPTRFWFRADAVPNVSASFINFWPDSSPYKNHATASSAAARPLMVTNQLNGYPAVRFDGSNDQMRVLTPNSVSASAVTAFVVAKIDSYSNALSPSNVGTIIGNGHPGMNRDMVIGEYLDGGSLKFSWVVYTEDSSSTYSQITPTIADAFTSQWYLNTVIINGAASSTNLYLSGSVSGSGTGTESSNLDLRDLYIGYESTANQPLNGEIAEIIIVTQSMSTTDQQKVEGYLAWKYGLQGSLLPSHPYKNLMPTPSGSGNIQVWKDFGSNTVAYLSASGIMYVTASNAWSASKAISSSWAENAISASWAPVGTADASISASWASESFFATTSSFASQSLVSFSGSWASRSFSATSASWASASITASYAEHALSASWSPAQTSNFALSASWASASISASYASQSYLAQTASFSLNANPYALSASWASSSLNSFAATSASYASRSFAAISASWASSSLNSFAATSASWASSSISASWAPPVPTVSSSWADRSGNADSASYVLSASFASRALTASFALNVPATASWALTASQAISASWSPPQTQNTAESASWASASISASYATNASQSAWAVSASWAPAVGTTGANYYIPKWLGNSLTTASLIYDNNIGVGIYATASQIDAALTVAPFPSTSSVLWTPSNLPGGVRLWLRADDVIQSNSSSVAQWIDTGSYGNAFSQSTAASQPYLFTNVLNGHSVVRFDGSNDYLSSVSASTSIVQSSLCCFVVAKTNTYPSTANTYANANVIGNGHTGNSKDFTLGPRNFNATTKQWSMYNESAASNYNITANANLSQSWFLINGTVNGNNSILTVYYNTVATSSGVVNGSNDIDLRDLYVGYEINYGLPFNGDIAEIIITPQVLADEEQRKVEGYLAWKYNLTGTLPPDNPYAGSPPYALSASVVQSWKNANYQTVAYVNTTGLYVGTASWANNAVSASWAAPSGEVLSSSYASTASYFGNGIPNYIVKWATSSSLSSTSLMQDNGTFVGSSGSIKINSANTSINTINSAHLVLNSSATTGQAQLWYLVNGANSAKLRADYLGNLTHVSYANSTTAGQYFVIGGEIGDANQKTKMKITSGGTKIGQEVTSDTPSAILHIGSGDGTATRGQIKFDSATLLVTPEAGVMEYQTDNWYGTISSGTARKQFAICDIPLASGSVVVAGPGGRLTNGTGSVVANFTASYAVTASFSANTSVNWPAQGWSQLYLSESLLGNTARTMSSAAAFSMGTIVGGQALIMGGYNAGALTTIWSSSIGEPVSMSVVAGKTLPFGLLHSTCVRIGNSLYIYGGCTDNLGTATSSIFTASITDPATWMGTGSLPADLGGHGTFVVNGNNDIWLVGGVTTGLATNNSLYYATASNPLSFSVVTPTWVGGGGYQTTIVGNAAVLGDKMCLFGGFSGPGFTNVNTSVFTASVSNPTVWNSANAGAVPAAAYIQNSGVVVGNYYYTFGGWNGSSVSPRINRASISSPGGYLWTGNSLPFNDEGQVALVSGSNKVYVFGGFNMPASASTNHILSASIINLGVTTVGDPLSVDSNMSWSYAANYFVAPVTQSMTASYAVLASQSYASFVTPTSASKNFYIPFVSSSIGAQPLYIDTTNNLTYNPFTDTLGVPYITSSFMFGTASWALNTSNVVQSVSASYASFALNAFVATSSISSSWASASLFADTSISSSWASSSISASWAPPIPSEFSLSSSWASQSFYASSASWASSSVSSSFTSLAFTSSYAETASWIPMGRSVVLCSAFTPTVTGGDPAEVIVPFHPYDNTQISWSIKRLSFRVQTAETITSTISVEKSSVTGAFSASYIGSVSLPSGSYENYATGTFPSAASGDKLRFNVTALGAALNWTIITELSNG